MTDDVLAQLTEVATTGAGALVTAMVSDAWTEVKEAVAGLLSRGNAEHQKLHRRLLDESRQQVLSAEPATRPAVTDAQRRQWTASLRQALISDPALALQLAALVEEVSGRLPAPGPGVVPARWSGPVHMRATADRGSTVNQVNGDLTQHVGNHCPDR